MPRRGIGVVPQTLEIRRQITGTRGADHEVTTVGEEQGLHLGVERGRRRDPSGIGRHRPLRLGRCAEVELHPIEHRPVRSDARGAHMLPSPGLGRVQSLRRGQERIDPVAELLLGSEGIIGRSGHQDRQRIAASERDPAILGGTRTALGNDLDPRGETQPVVESAAGGEAIAVDLDVLGVRILPQQMPGMTARLVGSQAHTDDSGFRTGEQFALKSDATHGIADAGDRGGEIQVAPVARHLLMPGLGQPDIPQGLVGTHAAVVAARIVAAGPQAGVVEHQPLSRSTAEDQGSDATVADREGLGHVPGVAALGGIDRDLLRSRQGTGLGRLGIPHDRRNRVSRDSGSGQAGNEEDRDERIETKLHADSGNNDARVYRESLRIRRVAVEQDRGRKIYA